MLDLVLSLNQSHFRCEFLLQKKGPDFVHRIVALFPNLPRPRLHGGFDVPPGGFEGSRRRPSPPPPIIDPRVIISDDLKLKNKCKKICYLFSVATSAATNFFACKFSIFFLLQIVIGLLFTIFTIYAVDI